MRRATLLTLLISTTAAAQSRPTSQPTTGDTGEGRFHLLFTSDIYGRYGWPGCEEGERDGADLSQLVSAVERRRRDARQAGDGEPLVVAAGSMIRPDAMGNHVFNEGRAWARTAVDLIARVGFDAVAVGTYDFGSRPDALEAYMAEMGRVRVPLLAANVVCKDPRDFRCRHIDRGKRRRYLVLERGGLRVGLFGVVREDLETRILGRSARTLDARDPVEVARKLVDELRRGEKVDLVVVLANLNLESNAPEPVLSFVRKLKRDAPDLVVTDNMFYLKGDDFITRIQNDSGPPILGTDRFGQHLGEAVVHYSRDADGRVSVSRVQVEMQPVASLPPDRRAARLVEDLRGELCRALNQRLGRGRFREPVSQDEFVTYVMEIMRNRVGAEIALLNESAVADTSFPMSGALTREKALRAIRTETHLGTIRMSGARLKKVLASYVGGAPGLNVLGLTRQGTSWYVNSRTLLDGQHYKVAVTKFVASGGDGLISLLAEKFWDSGFSLRRVVVDFFEEDRQAALDGDATIDVKSDFPDPWRRWLLYGESNVGVAMSNLSVQNGPGGKRYNKPQLLLDNVTALKLEMGIGLGASNRDHAVEADIGLKYGKNWTLTAKDELEGKSATGAETVDQVRADFLYRLNLVRNRRAPGRWYLPVPYAEATLISEFTSDNTYTKSDGREGSYHYLELGGTVGLGFLLHPYLFAKAGFALSGELLTPSEAFAEVGEERAPRTGLYLGYKLRRLKLIASVRNPLQLESRLDYFATDLAGTRRQELSAQSKLYFGLTPYLSVTASHTLYVFDNQCTRPRSECFQGENDTSVANSVALGLDLLLDYRHQLF